MLLILMVTMLLFYQIQMGLILQDMLMDTLQY